ncbi:MAG: hypothetical protein KAV42_10645 [Candidatus Krumholzibacteria bacterium]|nr:hypothetical protein [Candidatus Krumholzibacteria bacterium]
MMNPSVYRTTRAALMILVLSALVFSACSGRPDSSEALYGKMIDAYGGADGVDRIVSFSGKGFMRKLPMIHVAESYPFDIFQDGLLSKSKMMDVRSGQLFDMRIIVSDEERIYQWSHSAGELAASSWEKELVKYRFPYVLKWIGESGLEGEITLPDDEEDGLFGLTFRSGSDIISLGIDEKTFLLRDVTVTSSADSTFNSRDVYSDFLKVEGTWFPSRFIGYFDRRLYYEYYLVKIDLDTELPVESFAITPEDTAGIRWLETAGKPVEE